MKDYRFSLNDANDQPVSRLIYGDKLYFNLEVNGKEPGEDQTYKWYSDLAGEIEFIGQGRYGNNWADYGTDYFKIGSHKFTCKLFNQQDELLAESDPFVVEIIEPEDIINLTNGTDTKRTIAKLIARSPRGVIGLMSAYLR